MLLESTVGPLAVLPRQQGLDVGLRDGGGKNSAISLTSFALSGTAIVGLIGEV